jgi:MoaA/NifB/PqqE/SkfB family radical SAM enzyme
MARITPGKQLFKIIRKESLKVGFRNLPSVFWSKISSPLAKKLAPLTNGRAPSPIVISFYLTEICNLNCKMCFLKQIKSEKKFLSMDIVKKVIKELIYLRPRYNLTGGEPFLHPDIKELITHIKSKGLYLSIVSNGTLLENFTEIIVHSGIDKIDISIDGTPDKHDSIRRSPGAFSKAFAGIQAINYEKKKQNKTKPSLAIYSLLNTDTDVNFIMSFAQENSFKEINFLHLLSINSEDLKIFSEIYKIKPHYWKGAIIDDEGFKIDNSLIKKIKSYEHDPNIKINIRFTPNIPETDLNDYYNKNKEFLYKFSGRCTAPWLAATIKPPGKVEICPDFPVGDLTHDSFLKIWNGKRSRDLRKEIFEGNMLPVCSGCCNYYM